jgi:hypothetical protein
MELLKNLILMLEASNGLLETYCQRFKEYLPKDELKSTLEGIEMTKQAVAEFKKHSLEARLKHEGRQN